MAEAEDSPAGALRAAYAELGKQEKSVARAILKDYPVSALSTVAALAGSVFMALWHPAAPKLG